MVSLALSIIAFIFVGWIILAVLALILGAISYTIKALVGLFNWVIKKTVISSKRISKSIRMRDFAGDFSNQKITAGWLREKIKLYDKFVSTNASNGAGINEVAEQFDDMLGLSKNLCKLASEIGLRLNGKERLFISDNKQEVEEQKDYYRKNNYLIPTWRFKTVPISSILKGKMWSPDFMSLKIRHLVFNFNARWASEYSSDGVWSMNVSDKTLVFESTTQKHFEQAGERQLSIQESIKNIKLISLSLFKPGTWILDLHNFLIDFKEELESILDKEKSEAVDRARETQINKFTPV